MELDKDVALPKLPLNCGPKLVYVAAIAVSYKQLFITLDMCLMIVTKEIAYSQTVFFP
jgi:hypothetical protein